MDTACATYLDHHCRRRDVPFVRECRLSGSAPVCLLDIRQPAGAYPDPPAPVFALSLVVGGRSNVQFDMGAGRGEGRLQQGQLFLAPPDTGTDYVLDGGSEILVTSVPAAFWRSALREASPGFTDFGWLHAAPFFDPFVESICRRLWEEAAGDSLGATFVDYGAMTLAAILLRRSVRRLDPPRDQGAGLAPWRLRRVADYVEQNLGGDPSLSDLAQAAGLSPWHFARALRRVTGISPVRYLQQCRVDRAKMLLSQTNQEIVEIALLVGFKSQEHFSRVFRRLTGTTPGSYRRMARV